MAIDDNRAAALLRDGDLAAAFDRAAAGYDRLVACNPGYHAHLRRSARRLGPRPGGPAPPRLLDLGCGTGASTAALLAAHPGARVTAVDASAGMLARATAKRWPPGVTFVHAPAERLADAGVTGPFDGVLAAYLFRNVVDPDRLLRDVRRFLAPGGRLAVHEYMLSGRPSHRAVWAAVCGGLVRPVGSLTGDRQLYRHLWHSVVSFDTAAQFADRVRRAGFHAVRAAPMPGWQRGIVHTVVGTAA
ncbi:methyltransferase domain-containing protein [Streptomyces marincola]|uniref:Ubiquinone biosynthesis methyltransferase UbiE n=1 Tax=Streptomyces marincola TaxID=2878388 RepID=A0A1W7CYT4_9ACTN|nr:methyltransferase domain-containing protein [Streptomyces marincola]ARQ70011.1 ubiquinone biosynthesis methyltransferase UbiE [Streptomyces marincola]